ncbi:MAG: glycosyltransferase family 4 protein [Verrucomicrobiae bacterium]|nr:glycosyltransferase family 4 protein [Verrucomicrobiae bacterium]
MGDKANPGVGHASVALSAAAATAFISSSEIIVFVIRVLQVVKTAEGAQWAARQARVLRGMGVETHVAVPTDRGKAIEEWEAAGATVHVADLRLPLRQLPRLALATRRARELVAMVQPDVIHSHFVTTTCLLRIALGRRHTVPRIFQVAGPLHLEHWWTRRFEIGLAGPRDYWVGSSRCINSWYRRSGVPAERIFLSYWGFETRRQVAHETGKLRQAVAARPDEIIVGNVSWMYPPKFFLGQRVGLKCHEDLIEALGYVCRARPNVLGVIVGGAWNGAGWYEQKLKRLADKAAGNRIRFTGPLPGEAAKRAWKDFDLAVHVPLSENCGGVIEPLNAGVPVIASAIGGLPEVVIDGRTGLLIPPRRPYALARAITDALDRKKECLKMAAAGKRLVDTMFDVERTAQEVYQVYRHLLDPRCLAPVPFDSVGFLGGTSSVEHNAEV